MIADYLPAPERQRYLNLKRRIEKHLGSVPINHRTSLDEGCGVCDRYVRKVAPLILRSGEIKANSGSLFTDCTTDAQLQETFHSFVGEETSAAVSIMLSTEQHLRTFRTLTFRQDKRDDTNPYFPRGVKQGLEVIRAYATAKQKFITDEAMSRRWFGIAMLCTPF